MRGKRKEWHRAELFPLVITAAFLLVCLSAALVTARAGVRSITDRRSVSGSDSAGDNEKVRKTGVMENDGLRYRMVSASDLGIKNDYEPTSVMPVVSDAGAESETVSSGEDISSEDVASGETSSDDGTSSVEETSAEVTSAEEASSEEISSEEISSEEPEPIHLILPNDLYINFTPQKEGYIAYLTFDDGPSEYTEDLLDILDYYGAKATFFVVYHKDMADKYKAIVDRGHTIGLHTYTHKYEKVYRSESAFFNEITRIQTYVQNVTGVRSKIIRFPGGSSNSVSRHYCEGIMDKLKKSVPDRGYVYHDWNVDSGDAEGYNIAREKLLENVKKRLTMYRKPDILMHDAGASKRTTVEALPEIIEYIYSQGYTCEGLKLDSYAVHHNW